MPFFQKLRVKKLNLGDNGEHALGTIENKFAQGRSAFIHNYWFF
jgi:hypothetical protein